MDLLQLCAQKYAELCYYTYDCTIARKNTAIDLHFTFSPYEFRHLAGLHRLEHDRLRSNSERVFTFSPASSHWPTCDRHIIGAPRAKKSSLGWKLFLSSIL